MTILNAVRQKSMLECREEIARMQADPSAPARIVLDVTGQTLVSIHDLPCPGPCPQGSPQGADHPAGQDPLGLYADATDPDELSWDPDLLIQPVLIGKVHIRSTLTEAALYVKEISHLMRGWWWELDGASFLGDPVSLYDQV